MEAPPQTPEGPPQPSQQSQPPQRYYGRDYLELLSHTDFLDINHLFFVQTYRNRYEYQELLIYEHSVNKSKQQDTVTHRYLVVMDPAAKNHLGSSYRPSDHPESNVDIDLDQPKQLFESMVMALEATPSKPAAPNRSTRRSANQVPATKIPRFVVEIGEIKVEIYRNDGIDDIRYIGCHMVMDIETPLGERAL
ncbi:hypothetical protein PG991_008728 [Apiospora marii]|uniref:Uncharacterized protein n=1 Tax=Apiospora marii TaxID=335849 RepID=A0ABR1RLL5_9PEZI